MRLPAHNTNSCVILISVYEQGDFVDDITYSASSFGGLSGYGDAVPALEILVLDRCVERNIS